MAFDQALANAVSTTFRASCANRLNPDQLRWFETILQYVLQVKNIRNVQLWTRFGAQTRNIINRGLGQEEMDLRYFIADRFIQNIPPVHPVKTKVFQMPPTPTTLSKIEYWLNDNWIREYCTRLYFTQYFFIIEYSADSNTPNDLVSPDSPEFDDVTE